MSDGTKHPGPGPEAVAKRVETQKKLASDKEATLFAILTRRHANGEEKPNQPQCQEWLKAAGFNKGLASTVTQRLIVSLWGAGKKQKEPEEPEGGVRGLKGRLARIEAKLDKLVNLLESKPWPDP